MDPDHDQGRQGNSNEDNNERRTADVDSAVDPNASSSVGSNVRTVDKVLLSDRESWNFRQNALSGEDAPSNNEADTELVELTILCAHNLKNLRLLGSMNPRAKLYIDRDFTVKTLISGDGGPNPHWNYRFWFKIDDACFQIGRLTIEIIDRNCLGRDRLIGTARMPMSDLSGSNRVKKFFSYQVQVPSSGHFQGVVHVFVRRVEKARVQMSDPLTNEPWTIKKAGYLEIPLSRDVVRRKQSE